MLPSSFAVVERENKEDGKKRLVGSFVSNLIFLLFVFGEMGEIKGGSRIKKRIPLFICIYIIHLFI